MGKTCVRSSITEYRRPGTHTSSGLLRVSASSPLFSQVCEGFHPVTASRWLSGSRGDSQFSVPVAGLWEVPLVFLSQVWRRGLRSRVEALWTRLQLWGSGASHARPCAPVQTSLLRLIVSWTLSPPSKAQLASALLAEVSLGGFKGATCWAAPWGHSTWDLPGVSGGFSAPAGGPGLGPGWRSTSVPSGDRGTLVPGSGPSRGPQPLPAGFIFSGT